MAISENKMQIVIDNYFKSECDINTSIRSAFEKGFRIGVKKASSAPPEQRWIPASEKLPDKEGNYLVTVLPTYNIRIARWIGRWVGYIEPEILAWMPLPEPARLEGE